MQEAIIFSMVFHLIGDFYLQSDKISRLKKENNKIMLLHAIIYSLPFILLFFLTKVPYLGVYSFIFILLHYVIDKFKVNMEAKLKEGIVFLIDQLIHVVIAVLFIYPLVSFSMLYDIDNYFLRFFIDNTRLILLLLLIFKPCNIIFMVMFGKFRPNGVKTAEAKIDKKDNLEYDLRVLLVKEDQDEKADTSSIAGAGAIIGSLERVLIVALILTNNLSLIGFVLGIKSFARFEMISKSRSLSEYYIIGTLYSYAYTFILYYLLIVV